MTNSKTITYHFHNIDVCNMCLAPSSTQKVLGKRLNHSQGKKPSGLKGITTTIVKCKNCGLIFSNPLPVPQSMSDHYGKPPEDYWVPQYFELEPSYFQVELSRLSKLIKIDNGTKALDIGAGIGKCMAAMNNAGIDSYGFEPSEPFYERALSKMKINPDRLKVASIETAEYENNFFDFITFGAVLEHLYDPSESIAKALQWLKPGGIIHIQVPSSDWLINKIANFYYKIAGTDYVANISPMHTPYHLYEFSVKSFAENAKRHNYEIAQVEYWVASTYMPKIISGVLFNIMKWTKSGMQLEIWLRKK